MRVKDLRIGTKLYLGFFLVVLLFTGVCLFELARMQELGRLQDEGATLAKQAIDIHEIELHANAVYASVADAVINRDLAASQRKLEEIKALAKKDDQEVSELVDTDEESRETARFSAAYARYIDAWENRLMPLLRSAKPDAAEISKLDAEIDELRAATIEPLERISESLHKESKAGDESFDQVRDAAIRLSVVVIFVGILLGALTDSVQEVIELDGAQVLPAPRMGTRIDTRVIRSMGKRDEEFIIILDINRVFSADGLKATAEASLARA